MVCLLVGWMRCSGSELSAFYAGYQGFRSRPGGRLYCARPLRRMWGKELKLNRDLLIEIHLQFFFSFVAEYLASEIIQLGLLALSYGNYK